MLTVVVFDRKDGTIASGFLIPSDSTNGIEMIASEYKNGKYCGLYECISAGKFRATLHLNSNKVHPWINIDAETKNVNVLCARD